MFSKNSLRAALMQNNVEPILAGHYEDFVSIRVNSIPKEGSPTKAIEFINWPVVANELIRIILHANGDITLVGATQYIKLWHKLGGYNVAH